MIDIRTDHQKERDKRADEVARMFLRLKENNASVHAKMVYISNKMTEKGKPITVMGIKGILKRKNLYNVKGE